MLDWIEIGVWICFGIIMAACIYTAPGLFG